MMNADSFARLEAVVARVGVAVRDGAAAIRVVPDSIDAENPTTDLDRRADEMLCSGLLAELGAGVAYLSEERADDPARLGASRVLIVDPIDGTRNLVRGLGEAAVSVALWRDGTLAWAAVHNPFSGEMFTATAGGGAWRGGQRLVVTSCADVSRARLVVSRHETERGLLAGIEARVACRPVGSIAYKMALVAAGEADGTVTAWTRHEWDIAAGTLLVREAGGIVTDAAGLDVEFNRPDTALRGVVVSNGKLHAGLLGLVRTLRPATSAG